MTTADIWLILAAVSFGLGGLCACHAIGIHQQSRKLLATAERRLKLARTLVDGVYEANVLFEYGAKRESTELLLRLKELVDAEAEA